MEQKASSVEGIINALSDFESSIDNISSRVEEMKRRIMVYSSEEIERLKQQITSLANEEAAKIIEKARTEAEAESAQINLESQQTLSKIEENINKSYDRAVEMIVRSVMGQKMAEQPRTVEKNSSAASVSNGNSNDNRKQDGTRKVKKLNSDGKPV